MSKINCVISCPIDTFSGYGSRSRDFVKALVKVKPDWDINILPQRWGSTRMGYLDSHGETDLLSRIINKMTVQPDVWFQITIPNEFQPIGKQMNIGVTAGIETTLCDSSWLEGCNRMNFVITSSTHSKNVFENSMFKSNNPNQSADLKLQKDIEVLFEGVDLDKYVEVNKVSIDLSIVKESFAFLFLGHWLQGDYGHDRKNVSFLVKSFLETFKNRKDTPALILKTQRATASIMDREAILDHIDRIRSTVRGTLPNIYLLHGEMSDTEINELYNHQKVKAMINLTKGEGFGRPLLEFSVVNKPIIASGWSGQLDFLNKEFVSLVPGVLELVHGSAQVPNMILKESSWFKPDAGIVGQQMRIMFDNYKEFSVNAKRQGYYARTNFSMDKMAEQLANILDRKVDKLAVNVPIKLPKLIKVELPKLNKI